MGEGIASSIHSLLHQSFVEKKNHFEVHIRRPTHFCEASRMNVFRGAVAPRVKLEARVVHGGSVGQVQAGNGALADGGNGGQVFGLHKPG